MAGDEQPEELSDGQVRGGRNHDSENQEGPEAASRTDSYQRGPVADSGRSDRRGRLDPSRDRRRSAHVTQHLHASEKTRHLINSTDLAMNPLAPFGPVPEIR